MQLNASRIKVLQAQDDLVDSMKEAASKELLNVGHHSFFHHHKYDALVKALIVQVGSFPLSFGLISKIMYIKFRRGVVSEL